MIGVSLSLIIGSTGALDRASAQSGPTVWFGASTLVHHFDTEAEEFANIEAQLGQRFAITRTFKQWDDPFPNPTESWLLSTNHRLIVSLKAEYENGAKVLWDDIANSTPGTPIYDNVVRIATGIRDTGQSTYFIFHHEPEVKGHEVFGEAPQFIAAWRKIVTIFGAVGANQVKFLFTMTDHAFRVPVTDIRSVENWYPGDNWVDAVGADTYNWYDCRVAGGDWTSLEVLLKGQRRWGVNHPSKELWVPEMGSLEDPMDPTHKATWLHDAQALFKKPDWVQYRGIIYFNSEHDDRFPSCDWWIDTSSEGQTAIGDWLHDPYYGGDGAPTPPPISRLIASVDGGGIGYRRAGRESMLPPPTTTPAAV